MYLNNKSSLMSSESTKGVPPLIRAGVVDDVDEEAEEASVLRRLLFLLPSPMTAVVVWCCTEQIEKTARRRRLPFLLSLRGAVGAAVPTTTGARDGATDGDAIDAVAVTVGADATDVTDVAGISSGGGISFLLAEEVTKEGWRRLFHGGLPPQVLLDVVHGVSAPLLLVQQLLHVSVVHALWALNGIMLKAMYKQFHRLFA